MEDLIKALQIFLKYGNPKYPTQCEHDILNIHGINAKDISVQDIKKLKQLGFEVEEDEIYSFKYGNC